MSNTFDQHSANYRDTVETSVNFSGQDHDFFMQAKARMFRSFLTGHFGKERFEKLSALDVGCGVGAFHPHVDDLFGSLTGADISAESITKAKERKNRVHYQHYQPGLLPFADNSFDFTFTICVVHHVPKPEWTSFVADMARVTKPGGAVAIIEHNPLNPATRLAVMRCPFDEDAILLGSGTSRRLMAGAGLQQIKSKYFLLSPFENKAALQIEKALSGLAIGAQYATFGIV